MPNIWRCDGTPVEVTRMYKYLCRLLFSTTCRYIEVFVDYTGASIVLLS